MHAAIRVSPSRASSPKSAIQNPKYHLPMPDDSPKKRPLSEIGHLFLSNVRDQHLGGVTPPRRLPPGARAQQPPQPVDGVEQQAAASDATSPPPSPARPNVSIDLTPEEFARSFGQIALPDDL